MSSKERRFCVGARVEAIDGSGYSGYPALFRDFQPDLFGEFPAYETRSGPPLLAVGWDNHLNDHHAPFLFESDRQVRHCIIACTKEKVQRESIDDAWVGAALEGLAGRMEKATTQRAESDLPGIIHYNHGSWKKKSLADRVTLKGFIPVDDYLHELDRLKQLAPNRNLRQHAPHWGKDAKDPSSVDPRQYAEETLKDLVYHVEPHVRVYHGNGACGSIPEAICAASTSEVKDDTEFFRLTEQPEQPPLDAGLGDVVWYGSRYSPVIFATAAEKLHVFTAQQATQVAHAFIEKYKVKRGSPCPFQQEGFVIFFVPLYEPSPASAAASASVSAAAAAMSAIKI